MTPVVASEPSLVTMTSYVSSEPATKSPVWELRMDKSTDDLGVEETGQFVDVPNEAEELIGCGSRGVRSRPARAGCSGRTLMDLNRINGVGPFPPYGDQYSQTILPDG